MARTPTKTDLNSNRKQALDSVIEKLKKEFGAGTFIDMKSKGEDIACLSTGSIAIDNAIGIGGVPVGRIVEIYGPEASGKTTLTLSIIAEAQRNGKVCAFIDAENALDIKYATKLGVNVGDLLLTQENVMESCLEIADSLALSGAVDLIVVDSVATMVPKAEIEGDMGDSHMGLSARLMSQGLRKLNGSVKRNNCTIIFVNQLRSKIGVMFGNPETTTGGNALKYYASLRLDIRKKGEVKEGENVIGSETRVKVVKNKVAAPFQVTETQIIYGKGFNKEAETIDFGVKFNIIDKAGAWYAYNGDKIGQGKPNACKWLLENQEAYQKIEEEIRKKLRSEEIQYTEVEIEDEDREENEPDYSDDTE